MYSRLSKNNKIMSEAVIVLIFLLTITSEAFPQDGGLDRGSDISAYLDYYAGRGSNADDNRRRLSSTSLNQEGNRDKFVTGLSAALGYDYSRPQSSSGSLGYDDTEGRPTFATREDRSPHIISASNNPVSLTNTFSNERPKPPSYNLDWASAPVNTPRENRTNQPNPSFRPGVVGRPRVVNNQQTRDDNFRISEESAPRDSSNPSTITKTSQRISVQKCEEYKKYSRKRISFAPLLVNPTPIEKDVPQCDVTSPLIVGGVVAKLNEFPHMAALGYQTEDGLKWNCGGTLISENFVLTAAHCVKTVDVQPTVVRLGEKNLASNNDGANPIDIRIAENIVHPDYTRSAFYNDIALLKLERPVNFDSKIRPACLWQNYEISSSKATATGWGTTDFVDTSGSDNLLKVDLSFYTNAKCNTYYKQVRKLQYGIVQTQLCAGAPNSERDTCHGDSGGPLTISGGSDNRCMYYLVGVTGFGNYCGGEAPGVYARVSSYIDWIEEKVWPRQSRSYG